MITGPGLYSGIPEETYHADNALSPELGRSLSRSGARTLAESCPKQLDWERTQPRTPTDAMDFGSAVHALVLGGDYLDVVDADSWRTADAREVRDASRASRRVPILAKDYAHAQGVAEAVMTHPTAGAYFTGGAAEVSGYAIDPGTGVTVRARFDYLSDQIVDIKTAHDANPDLWGRDGGISHGIDIQSWWYPWVHALCTGAEDDEWLSMAFVVVQTKAPYYVNVFHPSDDVIEYGAARARRALDIYAECESAGDWPDWGDGIKTLDLPAWAKRRTL